MGTWAAGPFGNDAALDFLGDVLGELAAGIEKFVANPRIDDGFDEAFAAMAVIEVVCEHAAGGPPKPEVVERWRKVMLDCYDGHVDELEPDEAFKRDHRTKLVKCFDALRASAAGFWKD